MSVIYGDTIFVYENSSFKIPAKKSAKYKMPFCHQSVFVKTDLLKQHHFDTSFKICADNDFFTKIYHLGYKFHKINQIISVYDGRGFSSKHLFRLHFENLRVAQKYNRFYFLYFIFSFSYSCLKYCLKSLLKKAKLR